MTAQVSIALIGAAGRMGRAIARLTTERSDVRIDSAVEHPDSDRLGMDLGQLAGVGELGVVVSADLSAAVADVDVVVDLSHPESTAAVVESATSARVALVCGTTGLSAEVMAAFDRAACNIPLIHAPNLSPGVTVMTALLERAVHALGSDYDVEIVELHHRDKIDAPSGTALALAQAAANARSPVESTLRHGREGRIGARPRDEIGVLALRGGGAFGDHTVILAGQNERLEITHRAASRELFAEGALRATSFLAGKPAGRYMMADVLGI